MSEVVKVLERAKELLNEKGWCQGDLAKGAHGESVDLLDPRAASFCLVGAIRCQRETTSMDARLSAGIHLANVVGCLRGAVPDYNDAPGRTKEEIMEVLSKAIELAKQAGDVKES